MCLCGFESRILHAYICVHVCTISGKCVHFEVNSERVIMDPCAAFVFAGKNDMRDSAAWEKNL